MKSDGRLVKPNCDTYLAMLTDATVPEVSEETWANRAQVREDFMKAWEHPSIFFNALSRVWAELGDVDG